VVQHHAEQALQAARPAILEAVEEPGRESSLENIVYDVIDGDARA